MTFCVLLVWAPSLPLWLLWRDRCVPLLDNELHTANLTKTVYYHSETLFEPRSEPKDDNSSTGVDLLREKLDEYEKRIYRISSMKKEMCTMVMQTYKRVEILPSLIMHYCNMPTFHKVIIIWNEVGTPMPQALRNLSANCTALLHFVLPKENLLTNRFEPRKDIETDCELKCTIKTTRIRAKGKGKKGRISLLMLVGWQLLGELLSSFSRITCGSSLALVGHHWRLWVIIGERARHYQGCTSSS